MKKIMSATLILLFAFATTVSAHTGITSSSPADGEVVTGDVHEVVLEFNSKIESTSTVKVFNEKEEEVVVSTIQVADHVMTGGFMSPLEKGTYSVDWKIIGADGHPIQGSYSFVIKEENGMDQVTEEEVPGTPADSNDKPAEKPIEQQVEDTSKIASNDVLVVILVVLFTIAGGFVGWMIGRRQK